MSEAALQVVVIGGGAAGFFGAIRCAEAAKQAGRAVRVTLLEATRKTLTKVRISGGGRCNVTHHCFEPAKLVENYPRGARELRGPFSRFQPRDTVAWYKARGVELKAEDDGRMFPITDDSETIAGCLERSAAAAGVDVRLGAGVRGITRTDAGFAIELKDGTTLAADRLLLTTGSAPAGHALAAALGHKISPLVPSLFTFNIKDPRFAELAGVAFPEARLILNCDGETLQRTGPLLITHWGLSGPAVLKLSAFGAHPLHRTGYKADLRIAFLAGLSADDVLAKIRAYKDAHPKQSVAKNPPVAECPRRFWESLARHAGLSETAPYADLPKAAMQQLAQELADGRYAVTGKGVFKEEFVTAGGIDLGEVDFRSMASRVCPGLYFAGEILDADGITGGFNFQAAWTAAWIAGGSMVE